MNILQLRNKRFLEVSTLKFSTRIFMKLSRNFGNKHEMATLVMLLIGRYKTANLYLFNIYPSIVQSICECFIFYNKQRKSRIIMFKYFIIVCKYTLENIKFVYKLVY